MAATLKSLITNFGKIFLKIKINSKVESTQLALHVFQARKSRIDN